MPTESFRSFNLKKYARLLNSREILFDSLLRSLEVQGIPPSKLWPLCMNSRGESYMSCLTFFDVTISELTIRTFSNNR